MADMERAGDPQEFIDEAGFICRDGTNDAPIIAAITLADEYRLKGRVLRGWAIDIGAHIGGVALTLARQNPDLRVIAVEAVPENYDLLVRNIAQMGMGKQVHALHAWADAPGTLTGSCYYGYRGGDVEADTYVSQHRFIGNTWYAGRDPALTVDVEAVSLDAILERFGIDEVELLKIDCEGCEWTFLDTPAVAKVKAIVGEYHSGVGVVLYPDDTQAKLHDLLDATHVVTCWADVQHGDFDAVRR